LGQTQGSGAFLKQGEFQMVRRLKRMSFCSLAFIVLTAGSFGAASFAAATVGQANSNHKTCPGGCSKRVHNTSPRRQVASTKGNKHGERTIIFVGGRKGNQSAATKSNPTRARQSNGSLNPQPIPPGKQRQPE
jgi:hypothetical protein